MLRLQSVELTYNRLSLLLSIPVIIGLHESKDRLFLACKSVCLFVRPSVSLSVTCLCSTILSTKLHCEIDSILFSNQGARRFQGTDDLIKA